MTKASHPASTGVLWMTRIAAVAWIKICFCSSDKIPSLCTSQKDRVNAIKGRISKVKPIVESI